MKIRTKLLLAITVPLGLLVVQIAVVNFFVRELQQASTFISSTHETIEEAFMAIDLATDLRQEAKRLPSSFVSGLASGDKGLGAFRKDFDTLDQHIQSIRRSQPASERAENGGVEFEQAFAHLRGELERAEDMLANGAVDMDTLLVHAVFLDTSLVALTEALSDLSRALRVQLQRAVDRERTIRNRPVIAGIAIGGLSVATLLMFTWLVVDRHFITRIRALSTALLSIANGDLRTELPEPKGKDEVDEMARTVETFRFTALEHDRLLVEAGQAAERLEREVADRTAELASANQYKTRFLAVASHDLRQPLHALNLFIVQIRANPGPERRQELEQRISEAVTSINELFDALLDMSKLEAGVLEPAITALPIASVFERIERTFATVATHRGLRFRIVRSKAWISSDAILLERILLNLVSNAFRATQEGGTVLLGCRRRSGTLRIDVCDTGAGIPEEMQSEIFKEFFRLNASPTSRSDSLGLGLSIVDGLAQLLGHPIEMSSTPGRGTRFSLSAPAVSARPVLDVEIDPLTALEPMAGRRILVIEDDVMVRDSMHGILTSWGCTVDLAATVDSAIAAAELNLPDLVISDYRLNSGQTGLEAIAAVQKVARRLIPAFLITAETNADRLRDAANSGFPILHKPVNPMALRAMSSRLLADG